MVSTKTENNKAINMEKSISEKYAKLYETCTKNPEVVLFGVEERGWYLRRSKSARVYVKPTKRAKNGFIEKFCS